MKETLSGTAVIEDIEEATIIAFCEFAYRGRYKTPSRDDEENGDGLSADDQMKSTAKAKEPESQSEPEPQREHTSARESRAGRVRLGDFFIQVPPRAELGRSPAGKNAPEKDFGSYSHLARMTEHAKPTYVESPEERRWTQFQSLKFTEDEALPSANQDLIAHAKVYVSANRYLINQLREQSLKSLYRDLCNVQFTSQNVSHILDLLEYTFENTGRQEPGGFYSFRKLVIDYVACEARSLVKHPRFRQIMDENGEIGSDLAAMLVD